MADDTTVIDKEDVDTTTTTDDTATTTDKTVVTDDKATTTATDTTTTAVDDWRSRMAGEDAKALTWLGRYPTEADFVKDAKKRFDTVRDGKLLKPLGDDPSEAEVKAYRDAMGVPEKAEGYLDKLSGGLVVGADDRPIVDKFLEKMHAANAPASVTDAALQAYYGIVAEQDAAIAETTAAAKVSCEETLREEYGADYRRNTTAAEAYLGTMPAEFQAAINEGFNGKGVPLKSDPVVMKQLVTLALEANPLATVVPGAGTNQASAVAEEIGSLKKLMGDPNSEYWKGPNAAKMQGRYRELVDAAGKLKDRGD